VVLQPCLQVELAAGRCGWRSTRSGSTSGMCWWRWGCIPVPRCWVGKVPGGARGGCGLTDLNAGDAVMGLMGEAGSAAVVDRRLIVAMPAQWSFTEAAGVPVVF